MASPFYLNLTDENTGEVYKWYLCVCENLDLNQVNGSQELGNVPGNVVVDDPGICLYEILRKAKPDKDAPDNKLFFDNGAYLAVTARSGSNTQGQARAYTSAGTLADVDLGWYTSIGSGPWNWDQYYYADTGQYWPGNMHVAGILNTSNNPTTENMTTGVRYNMSGANPDRLQCVWRGISSGGVNYWGTFLAGVQVHVEGAEPIEPTPNEPGGGQGDFDDSTDSIPIPLPPNMRGYGNAALWNPDADQIKQLIEYIWAPGFVDNILKANSDPMQNIVSLHMLPFAPPIGGTGTVQIGNVAAPTISMNWISEQFTTLDFGKVQIKEYFGSCLDYEPYTDISIYLPYVGIKKLDANICMDSFLHVQYNIDILTGACIACVEVESDRLKTNMWSFPGNVMSYAPLYAEQQTTGQRIIAQLLNSAPTIAAGAAFAGAVGAKVAGGAIGSIASTGAASAALTMGGSVTTAAHAGMAAGAATGAAGAAIASYGLGSNLPDTTRPPNAAGQTGHYTGSLAYNLGWLTNPVPYLIINRPIQTQAQNFRKFRGYPCNITRALSELTGYTEVAEVHLEGFGTATAEELTAIDSALKGGVIL